MREIDLELDADLGVHEGMVADLVDDIRDEDGEAEATTIAHGGVELVDGLSLVALVTVLMTTAAGVTVLATFIQRVFRTGVTVECRGAKVRVKKNADLPRGSVFVVYCDGTSELREALSGAALSDLVKTLMQG